MRARIVSLLLPFFAVLAVAGTPVLPSTAAAAVERTPALGGESERTPVVGSHGSPAQLRVAHESNARPSFWKLPPHALTLRVVATPLPSVRARTVAVAHAPIAPPSAPRTCRGPPRTNSLLQR